MKYMYMVALALTVVACIKGPQGNTGTTGPAGSTGVVEVPAPLPTIEPPIVDEDEYRSLLGKLPLTEDLVCSLYTVPKTKDKVNQSDGLNPRSSRQPPSFVVRCIGKIVITSSVYLEKGVYDFRLNYIQDLAGNQTTNLNITAE